MWVLSFGPVVYGVLTTRCSLQRTFALNINHCTVYRSIAMLHSLYRLWTASPTYCPCGWVCVGVLTAFVGVVHWVCYRYACLYPPIVNQLHAAEPSLRSCCCGYSGSQNIPCIVCNLQVQYHVHKSTPHTLLWTKLIQFMLSNLIC